MRWLLILGLASGAAASADQPPDRRVQFALEHGAVVEFRSSPFVEAEHTLVRCQVLDWTGVCLVDGKPFFGTDWGVPRTTLDSAVVTIQGKAIPLDVSSMFNPSLEATSRSHFRVREVEGGYVLSGRFSDGAGSYEAEWRIIAGASVRTALRQAEE